jgi:hypothetical protein
MVEELDSLNDRSPMELVVQVSTRRALMRAASGEIWRVCPEVKIAVDKAIKDYNSVRAPFIKLNPVQRIGYLDEYDQVKCIAPFNGFTVGQMYQMTTQTHESEKVEMRKRVDGKPEEEILVHGMQVLISIFDDAGNEHEFTVFPNEKNEAEEKPKRGFFNNRNSVLPVAGKKKLSHFLQELAENFEIPHVPDVAECNPDLYMKYIKRLEKLEG